MSELPEEAFRDIYDELKRKPLDVNKYRTSAGSGRSQTLGIVNRRCLPPDASRQNWLRPKLYHTLLEFGAKFVPIQFNAITVNMNYRAEPHRDKNNSGDSFLVAFGDYTGGELQIHEGDLSGVHNIRHKPIQTDFAKVLHSVMPFEGERFSLVFYQFWTPWLEQNPLPLFRVLKEDNRYTFYRGDERIDKNTGLPHPLRKKPVVLRTDTESAV